MYKPVSVKKAYYIYERLLSVTYVLYIVPSLYICPKSALCCYIYIQSWKNHLLFTAFICFGGNFSGYPMDQLEASFFQLSLSPTVVINCVTLSGPSGLNDGGDQEEDASHEGGEGQPDGPLWQLWAGQLGLFFNFVEFSIQHRHVSCQKDLECCFTTPQGAWEAILDF